MPPMYNEALYRMVAKWTELTRVEFVPDAKRPGTKSYERYQSYSKARCVGEAIRLGAKPEDLLHDYHKKYLKLHKDHRVKARPDVPLDKEKAILENFIKRMRGPFGCNMRSLEAKKQKAVERLTKLGIDMKDMRNEKNYQESNDLQALRLAADCAAGEVLAQLESTGRKTTDKDLLSVLDLWAFRKNETRLNVLPEGKNWVNSDTLGLIRDRKGTHLVTAPTKDYPNFMLLLNRYLADRRPPELSVDFPFTTISLNYGYAAKRHRDAGNVGPSMIKAFGKFKGGRLCYWPDDNKAMPVEKLRDEDKVSLDICQGLALFDGNRAHEVEPFQGRRFSLVYFTVGRYLTARPEDLDVLRERGFVIPAAESMASVKSLLPPPRGYQSSVSISSMFGIREKPKVYQWMEKEDTGARASNVKELLFGRAAPNATQIAESGKRPTGEEQSAKRAAEESAPQQESKAEPRAPEKFGDLKTLFFGGTASGAKVASAATKPAEVADGGCKEEAEGSCKEEAAVLEPQQGEDARPESPSSSPACKIPESAPTEGQPKQPSTPTLTPPSKEQQVKGGKRMLGSSGMKVKRARCNVASASSKAEVTKVCKQATVQADIASCAEVEAPGRAPAELALPEFRLEDMPEGEAGCGRFSVLARTMQAAESSPTEAATALCNYFQLLLHRKAEPQAELRPALELLLPKVPVPAQAVAAAAAQAFSSPAPAAGSDLAAVVATWRAKRAATPGKGVRAPLTLAGVREVAQEAVQGPSAEATRHLPGLLLASRPELGETGPLVHVLLGTHGLGRAVVLSALAHAFVLSRPAQAGGNGAPAEQQAFKSPETQQAILAAMRRALALAYGETGGSFEQLLVALRGGCHPIELYSRCGPRCGTPILPMGVMKTRDLEMALAQVTGASVLVEQCYTGERVQLHKASDGSVAVFGPRQEDLRKGLSESLLVAIRASLPAEDCVLDGILQRRPWEAEGEILWVFDCLWLDGQALVRSSLRERRAALDQAVCPSDGVRVPPSEEFALAEPPTADVLVSLLAEAVSEGSEGLLLKRLEREYEAGCHSSACVAVLQPCA